MYRPNELDRILPRADFVLVTTPLTRETEGLIDKRAFSLMKHGAGIINMGRARVIDYDALVDNLRRGRLCGAILDVFDPEPLPAESRLWSTPNLVIVPHVSSDDADVYMDRTLDVFFDNVGGPVLDEVLQRLALRGSIVVCGSIMRYGQEELPDGPKHYFNLTQQRLGYRRVEGLQFPGQCRRGWNRLR